MIHLSTHLFIYLFLLWMGISSGVLLNLQVTGYFFSISLIVYQLQHASSANILLLDTSNTRLSTDEVKKNIWNVIYLQVSDFDRAVFSWEAPKYRRHWQFIYSCFSSYSSVLNLLNAACLYTRKACFTGFIILCICFWCRWFVNPT
jgi:hypothetical protein